MPKTVMQFVLVCEACNYAFQNVKEISFVTCNQRIIYHQWFSSIIGWSDVNAVCRFTIYSFSVLKWITFSKRTTRILNFRKYIHKSHVDSSSKSIRKYKTIDYGYLGYTSIQRFNQNNIIETLFRRFIFHEYARI